MPKDDPDPQDPMALVGMEIPSAGPEDVAKMVECFAQEFAVLGHDEEEILDLFRDRFYGGAHGAYRQLGEERVRALIHAAVLPFEALLRRRPGRARDAEDAGGAPSPWEV